MVAMEAIATLSKENGLNGNLAVQCALLHDTLEDTDTIYRQLGDNFGPDVANGVAALTKDKTIGIDIKKKWRRDKLQMADSLDRIRRQPQEIWIVKMADRVTNLQPPPKHWNQDKINRYREEAREIYEALKHGSPYLSDRFSPV